MVLENKLNITDLVELARLNDREVYMKGIDASYFYEGYTQFRTEDL